jgi:hypothetical protein
VREGTGDLGASTIAVLEEIAADASARISAALAVEDVEVPTTVVRRDAGDLGAHSDRSEPGPRARLDSRSSPRWRSLPIAPTALADFDHCSRRFELVHLLGLPEHVRGVRAAEGVRARIVTLDARAQGTLAHAVLERVPTAAFAGAEADVTASRALVAEGVPVEHAQHAAIVARVVRFLRGVYAKRITEDGCELLREVPFVLPIVDTEGRSVVLRGSMDLVVVWPNGAVDVVDYKSARGGDEGAYGFQLDVYSLAVRAMFPTAVTFRAGLVYLGGPSAAGEPSWRALALDADIRMRLAGMGDRLVRARWSGTFPRVALERCEQIYCGFIGRCHASTAPDESSESEESPLSNGTEAKPSRATTT